MSEFKREERFIVIKRKHLSAESRTHDSLEQELRIWLDRHLVPTSECVVVESDWSEYETVWAMLAARIEGRATPYQLLEQQVAALRQDKDRLDAIEGNCWDVRYSSSPNADAGDSSIGIEIVGHYQGAPHVRVLGESYTENLRAAIDQAMTAEAYPPERPEYDDHGRPLRAAKA